MIAWLKRLRGRYRAWWGFCPACNSDAPAVDTCDVCRVGLKFQSERNR